MFYKDNLLSLILLFLKDSLLKGQTGRCAHFGTHHIQISLTLRFFSAATFSFIFKSF